jgi:hypothetical protein
MYFDRFDVMQAWYLYLSESHEGQWSDKYRRLCKLSRTFVPGPAFSYRTLTDNGRAIYRRLTKKRKPV